MVNAIKSIRFIIAVTCSILCIWAQYSFAKTYAYFMGPEGKIAKIDADTNAFIHAALKIPDNVADLDAILRFDTINKNLFIAHCVRLGSCKVGVYDLRTLSFIKELPIESLKSDMQMVFYPDGSKFLINYLLPGSGGKEGGYTIDLYDAKTLSEMKNVQTFFGMNKVAFSKDAKKIYSVDRENNLITIDSSTFNELTRIDLNQIWRKKPEVFSSGIEYFDSGKILIFENLQAAKKLPRKLELYVYDMEGQIVSPKISTGLQGDAVLTPDGVKVIFDENQDVRNKDGWLMGSKSLGRMHIYAVATGKELKIISFKVQGEGKIRGIRPAGDRLYYESEGSTKDSANITVIDIKNYQVLTTISLPFKPLTMIFFEQ